MNLTIQPNQSILDAVLTQYGSLEAAMAFCRNNSIPISLLPNAGAKFDQPEIKGNILTKNYLNNKNITIGTLGNGSGCGIVIGLTISDITSTTLCASFVAGEGAIALEWAVTDIEPVSGTTISPSTTSLLVEGLTPSTSTKFWIRTLCSNGVSAWVLSEFTTLNSEFYMQMVLRPVMMHVTKTAGLTTDYVLNYVADASFYNRYPLQEDWPLPNNIHHTTKESIDEHGISHVVSLLSMTELSGSMASLTLQLAPYLLTVYGSIMVAYPSSIDFPINLFPSFIDVEGNTVPCSAVLVNGPDWYTLYYMQGTMDFGEGYTEDGMYKQPIIIGHHGDNPFFYIHSIKLMIRVGDHYETLATPLIGETVIVSLVAGRYELLLSVVYQSVDSSVALPASYNGAVLDIIAG